MDTDAIKGLVFIHLPWTQMQSKVRLGREALRIDAVQGSVLAEREDLRVQVCVCVSECGFVLLANGCRLMVIGLCIIGR